MERSEIRKSKQIMQTNIKLGISYISTDRTVYEMKNVWWAYWKNQSKWKCFNRNLPKLYAAMKNVELKLVAQCLKSVGQF